MSNTLANLIPKISLYSKISDKGGYTAIWKGNPLCLSWKWLKIWKVAKNDLGDRFGCPVTRGKKIQSSKQLLVGLVAGQGTKCTKPRICAYAANLVQLSKKSVIFQNAISLVLSVLDMGTAEVVRTHTAQDNPCGISRSQPPQDRSFLSPKLGHFLPPFIYPNWYLDWYLQKSAT